MNHMLANHLRLAWRNLVKDKFFSAINIGGFSVGLCICLLITLYVTHERSYDRFHRNADRIYALSAHIKLNTDTVQFDWMSFPTGPLVMSSAPSVESFLRTEHPFQPETVLNPRSPENKFQEQNFLFADSNFFHFFSFRLLRGNPDQVLKRPFTVVISQKTARKYFGESDPIGQLLKYGNEHEYEVTGIVENAHSNSEISYDFIASLSSRASMSEGAYSHSQPRVSYGAFRTYLLLKENTSPAGVQQVVQKLSEQNNNAGGVQGWYYLTRLGDVHLERKEGFDSGTGYLTLFTLIAGLILFLALANYMSLTTARATLRAKEIGIRKVSGAARGTIVLQFYIESSLYVLLAFILGLGLFLLVKHWFFSLLQFPIDQDFLFTPSFLGAIAGLFFFSVFISGSYPSLVLSAFSPVATLYGKHSRHNGGVRIRNIFTVVQFTISIALIVCSIIITQQLYYFRHTGNGVKRENVLMVNTYDDIARHFQAFRNEIDAIPGVKGTATSHFPFYRAYEEVSASLNDKDAPINLPLFAVDSSFIKLLGIQWTVKPRLTVPLPGAHYIALNEAAVAKFGLPPDPVGRRIILGAEPYEIIGVLKNFNYTSMHSKIKAAGLLMKNDNANVWRSPECLYIKTGAFKNIPVLLEGVKKIYERYDHSTAFNYEFMDDAFNDMYKQENRLAVILDALTVIVGLIACLGLLGLAAFSAAQKVREIGIRKVLGASSKGIVSLLLKKFIRQVLLSILIATPVAWYLMNNWLRDFAYRITISWWVFALSGLAAIVIAILTVASLTLKAAAANPVDSLRTD